MGEAGAPLQLELSLRDVRDAATEAACGSRVLHNVSVSGATLLRVQAETLVMQLAVPRDRATHHEVHVHGDFVTI